MTSGAPPPLVLLLQVGPAWASRHELLIRGVDSAWAGHPPLYVALPPKTPACPDSRIIVCARTGWVSMLSEALTRIAGRERGARYVLSLMDDHCPLRLCDAPRLDRIIRAAMARAMKCVHFVTYDWPWAVTAPRSVDERGRTMTWSAVDVLEANGCRFARVPRDFFRYNQCQPGMWEIEYYRRVCDQALEQGVDDPWRFEALLLPDQPPHYVSEYAWPSVHHGFLVGGRVNVEALHAARAASPALRALRDALIGEYVREHGRSAWIAARVRRSLRPVERPLRRSASALGGGALARWLRDRARSGDRFP